MGRLFAISDIHGCFKPFYELVVKEIDLKKEDRLILLGDYIDRGEQSKEVIDFIIDLKKSGFNITVLTGNHEQMLLDAYHDEMNEYLWFMNSGMATLISFGIEDLHELENTYLFMPASMIMNRIHSLTGIPWCGNAVLFIKILFCREGQ